MTREDIFAALLKHVKGHYVEIGTCFGGFTEWLARNTPADCIITVDPYKKFSKEEYCDALNLMTQEQMDLKHKRVKDRLEPIGVRMIRATSYEAANEIEDSSLSFCYIDGNHHYNQVLVDLIRWFPKVKVGGYLCGDDVEKITEKHDDEGNLFVVHQPGSFGKYGVHQALLDFVKVCPSFRFVIVENQFIGQRVA